MNSLTFVTAATACLAAGVVCGIFFAFSSFIMAALDRIRPSAGISAMQSINVVVINPAFLGLFLGSAVLALVMLGIGFWAWGEPSSMWLVAGGAAYLIGTLGITVFGNIPMNERLAKVDSNDEAAVEHWRGYVERWTRLNHLRGFASFVAAGFYGAGILVG